MNERDYLRIIGGNIPGKDESPEQAAIRKRVTDAVNESGVVSGEFTITPKPSLSSGQISRVATRRAITRPRRGTRGQVNPRLGY